MRVLRFFIVLCFLVWPDHALADEAGKILLKRNAHGYHVQYIPQSFAAHPNPGLLVMAHGAANHLVTLQQVQNSTRDIVDHWKDIAEQQNVMIIAPVFDQQNFALCKFGGYRSLFGCKINADDFLHHILNVYYAQYPKMEQQFYLWGHSAGGQFAARYLVKHPQNVKAAAILAPGSFPFPNQNVRWPEGGAPLKATMVSWTPGFQIRQFRHTPQEEAWIKAAAIQTTVIVGTADPYPVYQYRPFGKGSTRAELAKSWIADMKKLKPHSKFDLVILEGIDHDWSKLHPEAVKALFD